MRPHFAIKRHLAINATLHCTQTCALYNVTWFSDVWCSRGLKSQKWARPLSVLRPDPGLGLYHIKQCNVTAMHCNAMEWHVMFYNEAVGLYYINAMSPNKKCYLMHCTVLQWSALSVQIAVPGLGLSATVLHQCNVTAMQLSNAILQYYNVLRSTMKPDVYPAPGLGLYDINAMSSNRKCYQMHRTVLQWSPLAVPGSGSLH